MSVFIPGKGKEMKSRKQKNKEKKSKSLWLKGNKAITWDERKTFDIYHGNVIGEKGSKIQLEIEQTVSEKWKTKKINVWIKSSLLALVTIEYLDVLEAKKN